MRSFCPHPSQDTWSTALTEVLNFSLFFQCSQGHAHLLLTPKNLSSLTSSNPGGAIMTFSNQSKDSPSGQKEDMPDTFETQTRWHCLPF